MDRSEYPLTTNSFGFSLTAPFSRTDKPIDWLL